MAAAPVRPPVWPLAPANIAPGRADARLTAQKAFFEAALAGKPATAVAKPSAETAPRAAPRQAARAVAEADARTHDRLPPPGSLLDILV